MNKIKVLHDDDVVNISVDGNKVQFKTPGVARRFNDEFYIKNGKEIIHVATSSGIPVITTQWQHPDFFGWNVEDMCVLDYNPDIGAMVINFSQEASGLTAERLNIRVVKDSKVYEVNTPAAKDHVYGVIAVADKVYVREYGHNANKKTNDFLCQLHDDGTITLIHERIVSQEGL